ncbi:MAG: hypothetical protein H7281_04855 [Bacteriovorax sp.]|nr:hypothetical protein [Bacteriovorax sp.]
MKNNNVNFYSWMKSRVSKTPPSALDQRIIKMAKKEFNHSNKSFRWTIPTSAFATILLFLIAGSNYLNQQKNLNKFVLNEAPEMILNYDKIELMTDSSQLSENEWKKIEGSK